MDVMDILLARMLSGGGDSGGGGGGSTITVDSALSATSENPVQNKVIKEALDGKGTYSKPSGGIPETDLASAVQTSLGKADSAYQKPSGGVPASDMTSAVQTSLGNADSAYQKPSGGIPKTDLASAVQTSLGKADSAVQPSAISDMATKAWVGNQGYLTLSDLPIYNGGVT